MRAKRYGLCHECGTNLEPVFFVEEEVVERGNALLKTGRWRNRIAYLECPHCLTRKEPGADISEENWEI